MLKPKYNKLKYKKTAACEGSGLYFRILQEADIMSE